MIDYKWRVDILLKDRDGLINCVWVGPETKSTDVAKKSSTPNRMISQAFTDCQIITMSW